MIVGQHQFTVVQVGDSVDECQAEPRASRASARIQPNESPPRLRPQIRRNAGSAVPHFYPRLFAILVGGEHNLAAFTSIFDRIFDKVADGLGKQLPVAEQLQRFFRSF